MQVYSLLGFVDYEGSDLLGVFGSLDDLLVDVDRRRSEYSQGGSRWRPESFGFDQVGYVVSELGQRVDVLGEVEYL